MAQPIKIKSHLQAIADAAGVAFDRCLEITADPQDVTFVMATTDEDGRPRLTEDGEHIARHLVTFAWDRHE